MSDNKSIVSRKSLILAWTLFFLSAISVVILGALVISISDRRAERDVARMQMLTEIAQFESDNSKWGKNFPRQFNSWELTKMMDEHTKYGGSGFRDYLDSNPRLIILWAGYAFTKEYNQARGHYHAVTDVTETARITDASPGTCMTCKSSDVPRLMSEMGVAEFYSANFKKDIQDKAKNPIGCADCHDPKNMSLTITRPALIEAFRRMNKDITKASHQEMRSLVCAQCHSEYYFKGEGSYLTFPWDDGVTAEGMEKYFERTGHVDWVHAISGAKMIKMQHPDYEVYQQGIHAFRGVSCADCHMPYKSEGGIKFTDHQVRSPLNNIANSCQVCHRWSEDDIKLRVTSIQDKTRELLDTAEDALVKAHFEIADAKRLGATDEELEEPRKLVSKAQMYWDYVASTNGMGFHAPQESARVLGKSISTAQECRLKVNLLRAKYGALEFVQFPDFSTKDKAQSIIKPYVDASKK